MTEIAVARRLIREWPLSALYSLGACLNVVAASGALGHLGSDNPIAIPLMILSLILTFPAIPFGVLLYRVVYGSVLIEWYARPFSADVVQAVSLALGFLTVWVIEFWLKQRRAERAMSSVRSA